MRRNNCTRFHGLSGLTVLKFVFQLLIVFHFDRNLPSELCCGRSSSCCSRFITAHTSCSARTYPLPDGPWYFAASSLKFDHSCSWASSLTISVHDAFGMI